MVEKKKKSAGIKQEIVVPEGIEVQINEGKINMKKDSKELNRDFGHQIKIELQGDKIIIKADKSTKRERSLMGTFTGHLKNMIKGLEEGFEYELEIANVHFPMTVDYDAKKKQITIKNMLGEKYPRVLNFKENVEVEIKAPKINIRSHDIEAAGAVASKIEFISKVRNRDRNKFQDGIFITKKPGRVYL